MKQAKFKQAKLSQLILGLTLLLNVQSAFAATKFEQFSNDAETAYKNRNYPEAQKLFEQAIKESDKLDKNDKRIATTYYNLGLVFQAEGNYAEAEKNLLKAVELMSYLYGADHQRCAQVYMDLADLYVEQSGQEDKVELKTKAAEYYKKGIDIFEKIYAQSTEGDDKKPDSSGKENKKGEAEKPSTQSSASDLSNALRMMADFYAQDEVYPQAEPLYKRSIELEEFAVGPDDKALAKHKSKLAEMYCVQGKFKPAAPLFQEALASLEKSAPDSPDTANIMYNYGGLHFDQGEYGDAEVLFKKSLKILEKQEDAKMDDLALKSLALGEVLDLQGKVDEALGVFKKAIATLEKGEDKGPLIQALKMYQKHYLMQNNKDEASKIASKIKDLKASLKH